MHALIYNFYNFKPFYEELIESFEREIIINEKHHLFLVWSFSNNEDFKKFMTYKDLLDGYENITLITTSNLSFSEARNVGFYTAISNNYPLKYLSYFEDDHFYYSKKIDELEVVMDKYWGQKIVGDLKAGLFSYCLEHKKTELISIEDNVYIPNLSKNKNVVGAINSCMRSAPIQHYLFNVGNYEIDEYPTSFYQTDAQNIRNYNRGYISMYYDSKNIISHPDADSEENSLGIQTQGTRFDSSYSKSHKKLLDEMYSFDDKTIPFKRLIKLILFKCKKYLFFK